KRTVHPRKSLHFSRRALRSSRERSSVFTRILSVDILSPFRKYVPPRPVIFPDTETFCPIICFASRRRSVNEISVYSPDFCAGCFAGDKDFARVTITFIGCSSGAF